MTAVRLPTHVDFLLRVLQVRLAMLVQVVLTAKSLFTDVAGVRLVSAVDPPVSRQFLVAGKRSRAGFTFVGLVSCVYSDMSNKLTVVEERDTAEAALWPLQFDGAEGGSRRRCEP